MDNQTPAIGIINPTFTGPQDEKDQYGTTSMGQTVPPYCPNAGHQIPSTNPNPSGYPNQPYGAPDDPQGPYNHSGMFAYPQATYVGQTGVTVQPTVVVPVVTAVPDYLFYSIFTMLFCCLPLGIAATVYSFYVSIHSSRTFSVSYVYLIKKNLIKQAN